LDVPTVINLYSIIISLSSGAGLLVLFITLKRNLAGNTASGIQTVLLVADLYIHFQQAQFSMMQSDPDKTF
tara:strand:- start:706 stop:918 length:213 start_codon:yes stop_codon:yes gene_type:complete